MTYKDSVMPETCCCQNNGSSKMVQHFCSTSFSRGSDCSFLPNSPDLTAPCEYLWGILKEVEYQNYVPYTNVQLNKTPVYF